MGSSDDRHDANFADLIIWKTYVFTQLNNVIHSHPIVWSLPFAFRLNCTVSLISDRTKEHSMRFHCWSSYYISTNQCLLQGFEEFSLVCVKQKFISIMPWLTITAYNHSRMNYSFDSQNLFFCLFFVRVHAGDHQSAFGARSTLTVIYDECANVTFCVQNGSRYFRTQGKCVWYYLLFLNKYEAWHERKTENPNELVSFKRLGLYRNYRFLLPIEISR